MPPPSPLFGHGPGVTIFAALPAVDTHYVRAHVSQQHPAVGTGDEAAEIDHANSRERAGSGHKFQF